MENIIADESYDFAIRIVILYKYLSNEKNEYVLSKQLLRSGTAIGASVKEAEHAQSKAGFLTKEKFASMKEDCSIYFEASYQYRKDYKTKP